jgi:hypothetical protein
VNLCTYCRNEGRWAVDGGFDWCKYRILGSDILHSDVVSSLASQEQFWVDTWRMWLWCVDHRTANASAMKEECIERTPCRGRDRFKRSTMWQVCARWQALTFCMGWYRLYSRECQARDGSCGQANSTSLDLVWTLLKIDFSCCHKWPRTSVFTNWKEVWVRSPSLLKPNELE